ncbi:MAG: 2-aminoethylphosphonate aminotransferase [Lachnospiraceae bacterium]|nr:2-aminoethylphosphonate aminotransferase [Lachnospiraceae bacterium]
MNKIERKILLNPGPSTTTDTVKMAQVVPDICPREKEFGKIMSDIGQDLVRIVHGKDEDYAAVLFCGSGTICIDITLNSLLDKDKKALVVQNGSYSERACEVLRAYGLPFIELKQPIDSLPDLGEVEKALKDNDDIGYVYMTHHETGSGLLNPVREVGALAHKYGTFFITDTTSSYAMIPIDLYKDNIDFCMASAQKGIMGMTGLSYVIGRRDIIERSKDFPMRSYYCNLYLQYHFIEKTGQMHFTPPVQTIYAARQALAEYFEEGEQNKWERHQRVMEAIHRGEEELGLKEILDRKVQSGLVSAVRYPDDPKWDFDEIHGFCYERGFTIYPGKIEQKGTFRLCALGAIDAKDIEAFWKVFRMALEQYDVAIPVRYDE